MQPGGGGDPFFQFELPCFAPFINLEMNYSKHTKIIYTIAVAILVFLRFGSCNLKY